MLLAGVAFLLWQEPSLDQLDRLARQRNGAGLKALVRLPEGADDPFTVLKTGGAYEVGKMGWRAYGLRAPDGAEYVIIGTALTSQDVGEIVLRRKGGELQFVPETDALGIHLRQHKFQVAFDLNRKVANLTDTLKFESRGKGSFLVRMSPAYRVRSIADEKGKAVPFSQASGVVAVRRPAASSAAYKFVYDAVVDLPLYAGSITKKEATLVNDYWYPMVARQPTTYEILAKPPAGWKLVAQGKSLPAPVGSFRYRMDLPVVYFSALAAPFRQYRRQAGRHTFEVWSSRMTQEQMRQQTELTEPIVDFYAKSFGPWPFAGYGQVDSAQYGGGALEAYSFATYGGWLPSEDAHEPAHTYWGGNINNTYLRSFWNESFAVFSDGLYHREAPIGNQAERRLAFIQTAQASPEHKVTSLVNSGAHFGPVAASLGYDKGAKVLQMLEQWLGTDVVVGAMRQWVTKHPKGKPGEWEDFEAVLASRAPESDIKGFFDDWARRPGYADFEVTPSWAEGKLKLDLKWKSEPFRMPLTVLVRDASGEETFRKTFVGAGTSSVEVPVLKRPVMVSVDPWRQTLRPIDGNEAPATIEREIRRLTRMTDPKHLDYLSGYGRGPATAASATVDPAGKFLVGSPESWPALEPLCRAAGFVVRGNELTYRGTTIDLREGAALALIDLPEGKRCLIGLGKTEHEIDFGGARLVIVDRLGRILRCVTDPKRSGKLTYRL